MEEPATTTEQQQLEVEIKAVTTNIGKHGDAGQASYEIEQGRKLIAKAVSIGLPEQTYAELKQSIASYDDKQGR